MQILLVGPTPLDGVGGNVTTITRLRDGLRARGHDVRCMAAAEDFSGAWTPDLVHAFHAVRSGPRGVEIAARCGAPLVITLTGTDLRPVATRSAEARSQLCGPVKDAAAVVVFDLSMRRELEEACEGAVSEVIPQACPSQQGGDRAEGRRLLQAPESAVVFLMVAGLRPVKLPHYPIAPLSRLRAHTPEIAYRVLGPRLDDACADDLEARLAAAGDWARWVGVVPGALMPHVYAAADVVVNASLSEGMSAALLEAMTACRPLLASDIPGNRALVENGVNGVLFDGEKQFEEGARLLLDVSMRTTIGEAAGRCRTISVDDEVRRHLRLYDEVRASRRAPSATAS